MEWGDLGVSREINNVVFSLPISLLSGIIEDSEGYHIIRVLNRQDTYLIPFTEAQIEIGKKFETLKRGDLLAKYLKELKHRTPVTIYDDRPQDESPHEDAHRLRPRET